jgi:hypothetical protein
MSPTTISGRLGSSSRNAFHSASLFCERRLEQQHPLRRAA